MQSMRFLWPLLLCLFSLAMAVNLTARRDMRCIMYFTGYRAPFHHEPVSFMD